MPIRELRRGRARHHAASCGEATDLAVAQAVVDEREEMTRRGDASDVAAPAGADAGLDRGDLRVADGAGDGFDGGPAQQPGALLICGPGAVKGSSWAPRMRQACPASCRVDEGGQGRAAGPPGGAALTARSVAASTMNWGARLRASYVRVARRGRTPFVGECWFGRLRASLLISALGVSWMASAARWRSGCPDERGAAARSWSAVQRGLAATGLRGAGRRSSTGGRRRGRRVGRMVVRPRPRMRRRRCCAACGSSGGRACGRW